MTVEMAGHIGWIAIMIAIVAGAITMWKWPMNPRRSYSENIARYTASRYVFAVWMTVVTVLFYWFLLGWLGPQRGLGTVYYGLVWLMFLCQLTLAWVPATKGGAMLVHNIASYGLVVLMPVMLGVMTITSTVALGSLQLLVIISFIVYESIVFGLFFFAPAARQVFLWFQISLMVAVWATILIVAYSG